MPSALLYLGIMLGVIVIWFVLLKRPVYEAVFISFIVLVAVTGTWGDIWTFINDGLSTNLLYSMTAFVAMNTGVTALIARYKGQGDKEKANLVLRQGMMFTFISSAILSVLGIILSRPMVIFMGAKGNTVINDATI